MNYLEAELRGIKTKVQRFYIVYKKSSPAVKAGEPVSHKSNLGWLTGLEPATTGTTIQDSNRLNYSHHQA